MLENLHFIRPLMFLGVFVILLIYFLKKKIGGNLSEWQNACDNHLLEFILSNQNSKKASYIKWLLGSFWVLSIIALSGPSFEKLPQQTYEKKSPICIILDMSFEMSVLDIKPKRLDRAKFKIIDILKLAKSNPVSLIAYSGDAFVISPFTNDLNVIKNMLEAMDFSIMPVSGVRPEKAIEKALDIFKSSFYKGGKIYFLSSSLGEKKGEFIKLVKKAKEKNIKIHVIGVGTKEGGPVVDASGNFISYNGDPIISKLDVVGLKEIADITGGKYFHINSSDEEIADSLKDKKINLSKDRKTNVKADIYKDVGYYFMPLILFLALFFFKKGLIALVTLFFLFGFSNSSYAFSWQDLWLTKDMRAQEEFNKNNFKSAQELFKDPSWKGASSYKIKDYNKAIESFSKKQDELSLYNLGNSYALSGDFDNAIKTYEKLLKKNKNHEDGRFNYELVKKIKKQQEQQKQQNKQNNQDKKENNKKEKEQEQNKQKNKKSGKQENKKNNKKEKNNKSNNKKSGDKKGKKPKAENEKSEKKQEKTKQEKAKPVEQRFYDNKKNWDKKSQKQEQLYSKIPDVKGALLREMLYRRYQKRQDND